MSLDAPQRPRKGKGEQRQGRDDRDYGPRPITDPHRALPMSMEAEQGVLCSFLLSPVEVMGLWQERGAAETWFHIPAHQTIFLQIQAMLAAPMAVDIVTLTQRLHDHGVLESVGGAGMVANLFTFLPTAANVEFYLDTLAEKFAARQLLEVCNQFGARVYEEQDRIAELIDEAQVAMMAINRPDAKGAETVEHIKPSLVEAFNAIEEMYHHRGGVVGLSTGFKQLDRMTGGARGPILVVPAGRPSMGKSALLGGIAKYMALECGKTVAIWSLEMNKVEWATRILCGEANINLQRVRDGFLSQIQMADTLPSALMKVAGSSIYLDDTAAISIQELRVRVRRFVKAHPETAAIFIDYIQLMRSTTKRAQDNRVLEIGEITGGLKRLAKEINRPIFAAAQLNREQDGANKPPKLSNLRESGSIEQDADWVILLHRKHYYTHKDEDKGKATAHLAKQRNGPTGEIELKFMDEFGEFRNPEGQEMYSNDPARRQGGGHPLAEDEEGES